MRAQGVLSRLVQKIRSFSTANVGNVAITFALATLPIVGAVGFAVDYSHANSIKAAMQSALDSTALMLSKEAATDSSTQLQTNALKYFTALFTRPEAKSITITASYTASAGSQILVTGSAQMPTNFLGVIGFNSLTVNGSATARWGSSRLRVALVLDNTGSMADSGKITALKSATNSLLSQLQSAVTTNGDVYVSIIPFVKDVNLGSGNWSANYIYWDDAGNSDNNSWDANNGTCSTGNPSNRASCVANSSCSISGYGNQSSCVAAGSCSEPGPKRIRTAALARRRARTRNIRQEPMPEVRRNLVEGHVDLGRLAWCITWTPNNHNTWNGCVMDRGNSNARHCNNYDTNVAAPSASIAVIAVRGRAV